MPRRDSEIRLIVRTEIEKALKDLKRTNQGIDNVTKSGKKSIAALGSLKTVIGGLITVAAVKQVTSMAIELGELGAKAENVERAFKRIPGSTKLLNNMRSAVKGTVSDLELMRNAIIGIDLGATNEQLEIFTKFARLEAVRKGSDTLQTFQNILGGVLRGSTELLDNFGISLTQINKQIEIMAKEKLGKLGTQLSAVERRELMVEAAAKIMNDRLEKTGEIALTDAEKIKSAAAEWENLRVALGKLISPSIAKGMRILADAIKDITEQFTTEGQLKKATEWLNLLLKRAEEQKSYNIFEKMFKGIASPKQIEQAKKRVEELREELNKLNKEKDVEIQKTKQTASALIDETKARKDALTQAKQTADIYFEAMKYIYEKDLAEWEEAQIRKDEWQKLAVQKNIEGIKYIAETDIQKAIETLDALIPIWEEEEDLKALLFKLRSQLIKKLSDEEIAEAKRVSNYLSQILSSPIHQMVNAWAVGTKKGSEIWKDFLENLKQQIIRFMALSIIKTFLNLLIPGAGTILGGGMNLIAGAQEGEYIPGSPKGQLRRVGESNTPEIIVPVSKLNQFVSGDYTLPGGFKMNPPAMIPAAAMQSQSTERIIDRSVPVNGKVTIETVAPDYIKVRNHYIKIGREILYDDQEFFNQFLSTKNDKSEYE